MAVRYDTGNLLHSSCDALVNTVNCRGPGGPRQASMGAGLAKAFATQFPSIVAPYKAACLDGSLRPGSVQLVRARGKVIVNFPTKDNWHEPSRLEWVRDGLIDLAGKLPTAGVTSIAVPPLGCGLGGLSWDDVEPLVHEHLGRILGVVVVIYPPAGITGAGEPWRNSRRS